MDTDVGCEREINEDSIHCELPNSQWAQEHGLFFAVADGMGGHNAGEIASQIAVQTTRNEYYGGAGDSIADRLKRAVEAANRAVLAESANNDDQRGMGTTLVAGVLQDGTVSLANVGDCRAYRISSTGIEQLTTDHSWVGEQLRAGNLTEQQARIHPNRNLVTRALGQGQQLDIDVSEDMALGPEDDLLLCSDGLHGLVEDRELATVVRANTAAQAVERLVQLARQRGGPDNISVVLLKGSRPKASGVLPFNGTWLAVGFAVLGIVAFGGAAAAGIGRPKSQVAQQVIDVANSDPASATAAGAVPTLPAGLASVTASVVVTPLLGPTTPNGAGGPLAAATHVPAANVSYIRDNVNGDASRCGGVALRDGPDRGDALRGILEPGDQVSIQEREVGWSSVKVLAGRFASGKTGFVNADFLSTEPVTPISIPVPPIAPTGCPAFAQFMAQSAQNSTQLPAPTSSQTAAKPAPAGFSSTATGSSPTARPSSPTASGITPVVPTAPSGSSR